MDHAYAALGRHQRAGDGGIDIAHHQHGLRPHAFEYGLEAFHHLGRLHGVTAGADFQMMIGTRDAKVGEETVAHRRVVMLAGMQQLRDDAGLGQGRHHRGDLHEIGAGARDA